MSGTINIVTTLLQLPHGNVIEITKEEAECLVNIFFDREKEKFNDYIKYFEFDEFRLKFCYEDKMEGGYVLRTYRISALYADKSVADSSIPFYFVLQITI